MRTYHYEKDLATANATLSQVLDLLWLNTAIDFNIPMTYLIAEREACQTGEKVYNAHKVGTHPNRRV